jgi:hypothetical protein
MTATYQAFSLLVFGVTLGPFLHKSKIASQKRQTLLFSLKKQHPMNQSDDQEVSVSGDSLHSSSRNYSNHDDDGSGSSTTGTSATGSGKGAPAEVEEIASREDRAVAYSRVLVLSVLLVSATVAGVLTWIFSTNAEEEAFHTQVRPACSFARKQAWPTNSISRAHFC